jgi:radical SAM-linked protein
MNGDQTPRQRLRVLFAEGEVLKYISHLDLARAWERIFRRAGLPLAHTQGFNPRPRFQIAAALPVGVSGRSELLDLWLTEPQGPAEVLVRLQGAVPSGLEVLSVAEIDLKVPSLQSQVCAADYDAIIASQEPVEGICARVQALLDAPTLPRQRLHKGQTQSYDLRPLVQAIQVKVADQGHVLLAMRLQASPQGAGRPDEVLDALGLSLAWYSIERTNLCFEFDK